MRVGHLNVTRPAWYDRALSTVNLFFGAGNGGTGGVYITFASYTAPSNTLAWVESASVLMYKTVADGTNQHHKMRVVSNPSSTAGPLVTIGFYGDQVGGGWYDSVAGIGIVYPGAVLAIQILYSGQVGILYTEGGCKITQFV